MTKKGISPYAIQYTPEHQLFIYSLFEKTIGHKPSEMEKAQRIFAINPAHMNFVDCGFSDERYVKMMLKTMRLRFGEFPTIEEFWKDFAIKKRDDKHETYPKKAIINKLHADRPNDLYINEHENFVCDLAKDVNFTKDDFGFDFYFAFRLGKRDYKDLENYLAFCFAAYFYPDAVGYVDFLKGALDKYRDPYIESTLKQQKILEWAVDIPKRVEKLEGSGHGQKISPSETPKQLIIINPLIATSVVESLVPLYVEESQQSLLEDILKRKNVKEVVNFKGKANQLIELFRRMEYHKYFQSSKKYISQWLCENFVIERDGEKKKLDFENVYRRMTEKPASPKRHKRIDVDKLPHADY